VPVSGLRWLASAGLAGGLLLALEVVWFRFLALYRPRIRPLLRP